MCCNPANGRVGFEECLAYKIQLHGTEWIVSLSANWDKSPKKQQKNNNTVLSYFLLEVKSVDFLDAVGNE
jgi:hypothetical protein